MARPAPLCLKALGWELPHMSGATIWQRLHIHIGDACYQKVEPRRDALPCHMPPLRCCHKVLLHAAKRKRGDHSPKRLHFGHWHRWPYHFYSHKLPDKGLLLPCSSLRQLRLVLWLQLHDPLPYPPIFHLRCSDPVQHPLTKHLLWKTHPHWTLASHWPTCTQEIEQTDCGCGVRVTVRF